MASVTRRRCPRVWHAPVTEREISQVGDVFGIARLCPVRGVETKRWRVEPETRGAFGLRVYEGKNGRRWLSKDCDSLVSLGRRRLLQGVDQYQGMLAFPEVTPQVFSVAIGFGKEVENVVLDL